MFAIGIVAWFSAYSLNFDILIFFSLFNQNLTPTTGAHLPMDEQQFEDPGISKEKQTKVD